MSAHETRTFKSGNSEAVRLPKRLGFGIGAQVRVERDGDRLVLTPLSDPATEKRKWLLFLHELAALPKPSRVEVRERIEFPERSGL